MRNYLILLKTLACLALNSGNHDTQEERYPFGMLLPVDPAQGNSPITHDSTLKERSLVVSIMLNYDLSAESKSKTSCLWILACPVGTHVRLLHRFLIFDGTKMLDTFFVSSVVSHFYPFLHVVC